MTSRLRLRLIPRLSEIDAAAWDGLTTGNCALSHAFLSTLEETGCVSRETGWEPCHLTLWDDNETLVAAVPLYRKHHSYGEYVFDWAWADAYQRHGLNYYPKWLTAIPFTPIPGARLLARDEHTRLALAGILRDLAEESGLSSLHLLFVQEAEAQALQQAGCMIQRGMQFHWHNRGYRDFDDFLAQLNHSKRKKIRQERRKASAHGLTVRWLDGTSAREEDWLFFYHCYATTYAQHRSMPYLTPEFFPALAQRMPHGVRLLLASRDDGTPVAAAFFLCDEQALYGRYWGAVERLSFVHFELCYYEAIDYCIRQGLQRFEGGAQGEHKLSRGLEPVETFSAHWLRDERFADAVDRYLARAAEGMGFYLDELAERSPFRALDSEPPKQS